MPEQLNTQPPIAALTGVVLAGGAARRMGGRDKGLIPFRGRPLASYALAALAQVAGSVLINANRNIDAYARLGYPVIGDGNARYDGPLAGMLAALRAANTPYVLVVPCDCPLLQPAQLRQLYDVLLTKQAEVCAAHDGVWLNPVFAVLKTTLADDLQVYLDQGGRKAETWLRQHVLAIADFAAAPELFRSANTPEELQALEMLAAARRPAYDGGYFADTLH